MENRPIKELLIILRNNLKRYFRDSNNGGMCSVAFDLSSNSIISIDEYKLLFEYLDDHKPRNAYRRKKLDSSLYDSKGFNLRRHWWTPCVLKPRINWLNKEINKL